jgi:cbb3-type cytochrome oxidase subunit 1
MWQQGAAYYWKGADGQHHCKHSTWVRTLVEVFSVEVLTVSITTIIVTLEKEERSAPRQSMLGLSA